MFLNNVFIYVCGRTLYNCFPPSKWVLIGCMYLYWLKGIFALFWGLFNVLF